MTYRPTAPEWRALDLIALALRPDWTENKPGPTWYQQHNGALAEALNFKHCVDALFAYCTESKNGQLVKRTPNLYPAEGMHWRNTQPYIPENFVKEPCPDHPLDKNDRLKCIGCRSEILSGMRPGNMQGEKYVIADLLDDVEQ